MAKKLVTKSANGKINSFCGELKILSERKGWKQKVELWLLNDITNRNDWRYENLEAHIAQFAETPLLVAYVGQKIGDGHNFDQYTDEKGETKASFMKATAERIVGYFKNAEDIRIVEKDGVNWVVGTAYIWKWYAQELVDYLAKQELQGMPVSIETLIDEMYMDGTTEVFTKYQILGTTILGTDVAPAVKDAYIRTLQAIGTKDVKELTLKVASAQAESEKSATKNNSKGEKTKGMSKILNIADLHDKFEGYTVLKVCGRTVALLSADRRPYTYTFGEDEETVIPEKITAVKANSVFGDGEATVDVDVDEITNIIGMKLDAAQTALNASVSENAELKNKIATMESAEHARRVNAVKIAMKAQFEKTNSAFDGVLEVNACDDLMTEDCLNSYADMECNGEWIGEGRAIADIDARCMSLLRKQAEVKAQKNNSVYAWDRVAQGGADEPDEISGVISRTMK